MKSKRMIPWLLLTLAFTACGFCLPINDIGTKIWKNECGGKVEGLTHWNEGENFGSFGIGHFIWYPENGNERFQDTFPALLAFLKQKGVAVPQWLLDAKGCPWRSRDEFYRNIDSTEMKSLRQFLLDTKDQQATFMAFRLESALPGMMEILSDHEKRTSKKRLHAFRRS